MNFEINKIEKNSKKLWLKFKQWGITTNASADVPEHLKNPNELNKTFTNLSHLITPVSEETISFFQNNTHSNNENKFMFYEVTESDIYKAFKQIKSKCKGIDDIGYDMLDLSMSYISGFLKNLINKSLQNGEFPTIWKTSIIRPLPKVPNVTSFNELRPINILPILAKMFEKIVCDMTVEFISSNDILPDVQSGFRANFSTATALTRVVTDITCGIDESKATCLVLLDYSKAFDLINHDLLLAKMSFYNFSDAVCVWFSNYLSNRLQCVEIDGIKSDPIVVKQGVPQGSILGPILFNIFTSDLPSVVHNCNIYMYADDTQLVKIFDPAQVNLALNEVNTDLERINNWSIENGLNINASKSCFLLIGSANVKDKVMKFNFSTVHINNIEIPQKEYAKNLGVILDDRLNFERHVTNKLSILYMKLKALYKFKYMLHEKVKYRIVESTLYPQFDYCLTVYYKFLTIEYKHKLQLAQNTCLRFAHTVRKYDHVTPIYKEHLYLKVDYRYKFFFGSLLMKIYFTGKPKYLKEFLKPRQEMHNTHLRDLNTFNIYKHKTAKFQCCFAYSSVDLLNNAQYYEMIQGVSVGTFKKNYKNFLLQVQNDQ